MNKYEIKNDILTVCLHGRADASNSENIEKEIESYFSEAVNSMVLDLSEVEYISSAFLRVCLKLVKKFGKENFTIINVQPTVLKVFKIANFTELIKIG